MPHLPIRIDGLSLSYPHKTCFDGFSAIIQPASRIALIGDNGSGKTSLLNILAQKLEPTNGTITHPDTLITRDVPQIITSETHANNALSGGQRFNAALSHALADKPDLLLLDEPTNHLDTRNRRGLIKLLQKFAGTVIFASHDPELIRTCGDILWFFEQGQIIPFSGTYDDYLAQRAMERQQIEDEITTLNAEKKRAHTALMKEQKRAAKAKIHGEKCIENRKWAAYSVYGKIQQGIGTTNRRKGAINAAKQDATDRLSQLRMPEIIIPKFNLPARIDPNQTILTITNSQIAYAGQKQKTILQNINLTLGATDRLALTGDNGSGKTTFIRALMCDPAISINAQDWQTPQPENIGYLDQHYATLPQNKTVIESLADLLPHSPHADLRAHLNDFLFRKNEEVNAPINALSGGERARLALAHIAAKPPRLLILDEITNNIDLNTRAHCVQVLRQFPAALIVISHDIAFLKEINMTQYYECKHQSLVKQPVIE